MINSVSYMGRLEAERLELNGCEHPLAVVSITEPGAVQAELPEGLFAVCRSVLPYSLGDYPCPDDPAPHLPAVRTIVDFVQRLHHDPLPVDLIVHCEYGWPLALAVARHVQKTYRADLRLGTGASLQRLSDGSRGLRQLIALAGAQA